MSQSKFTSPTEDALAESKTKDSSRRFPRDRQLRLMGFAIFERKKDYEPKWIRNDKVVSEHEAVMIMKGELAKQELNKQESKK